MIHIALHIIVPAMVARIWFAATWRRAWLIMLAGMVVDVDHLLATPIYDPGRCSIGFHPLHMPVPIVCYVLMLAPRRTRLFAIGLLIHMVLDGLDCVPFRALLTS